MSLPFENLDDFFSTQEFAVDVLVGPVGKETTIQAMYQDPYVEDRLMQGLPIASTKNQLICKSSDVDGLATGTRFVVDGTEYALRNVEPDGTGMSKVNLKKP